MINVGNFKRFDGATAPWLRFDVEVIDPETGGTIVSVVGARIVRGRFLGPSSSWRGNDGQLHYVESARLGGYLLAEVLKALEPWRGVFSDVPWPAADAALGKAPKEVAP